MQEPENQKYEAQGWEIVPVRSIRTEQKQATPALNPFEVIEEGLRQVFPPEARVHFHAARRELLLAVRSIVDTALERVEKDVEKERSHINAPKQ